MQHQDETHEARLAAADAEIERLRAAYRKRRQQAALSSRYALTSAFMACSVHERTERMFSMLREKGIKSLAGMRILDVGCGQGYLLRLLLKYGATPDFLAGIDLLEENITYARHLSPDVRLVCGNAMHLPFPDSSFDLVLQFVMFTSLFNQETKQTIAREMLRVLAPQGLIIWYDFTFNNPKNADVRGIRKREIRTLFPSCEMKSRRITLAPPLGRVIAPISVPLYYMLSNLRFLCTHRLCVLQKSQRQI